ncbi:MAG: hypothetical protein ACXW1O_04620 [Halobacteriota archaeon]
MRKCCGGKNSVQANDSVDTQKTNDAGQIILTQTFGFAGLRTCYVTFAGDTWYKTSTSSVLEINVS